MLKIELPPSVDEETLGKFIQRLKVPNGTCHLDINFTFFRFAIPSAIAILLSRIHGFKRAGIQVTFSGLQQCPSYQYLQRMNFFKHCKIDFPEEFQRHNPGGSFVPIQTITRKESHSIESLSTNIADCIFPEMAELTTVEDTGPYDTLSIPFQSLQIT